MRLIIESGIGWRQSAMNGGTDTRRASLLLTGMVGILALVCWSTPVQAQVLTNTGNTQNFTISLTFGTLTPGVSGNPTAQSAVFRVRCNSALGYHLNASATVTVTPTAGDNGGSRIAPLDIGVGITSITYASGVITPRTDVMATGFNYDPGSVTATNGLTPYLGAASGQATLADLASSLKILNGPRVAATQTRTGTTNYLQVTMTFAALPQFFTPATFTVNVTLTLATGQ